MPSVSILHYTHKVNTDGTSPIVVQVIVDSHAKKRTLANVYVNQWNQEKTRVITKSHPNYATINIRISEEYSRIEKLILNNSFDLQRDFIDYFNNVRNKTPKKIILFKKYDEISALYVSSLKSGASMITYENRLKYFKNNATIGDIRFSEIKRHHIDKFVTYLESKGRKSSTIRTNLKIIKFASSFAERNGYDKKSDDLHNYKLPKAEKSLKDKFNMNELEIFKNYLIKSSNKHKEEARDMFLMAVYTRGMRIGDVLQIKQSYINDGRLVYMSQKNKKQFNIKLIPDALEIVNKYLDEREYLFTFFNYKSNNLWTFEKNLKEHAQYIKNIIPYINKLLKSIAEDAGLTKNISTHIAKHTFSKMAIKAVGGDFNLGMALTGNSSLKEYQTYVEEISSDDELDDIADKIFAKLA